MTDATHPDDRDPERDPDHDPIGPRLGRPARSGYGAAAPRPIAPANPMPNGLVLGEAGRRWRLLASVVSAARAVRLPVRVVAAGPSAVEAMEVAGIRGLPVSVAGRQNDSRPYRRAIERFLDGDPVEAGGRSLAARRTTEERSRKDGVPMEVVSEGASSAGAASSARTPGPPGVGAGWRRGGAGAGRDGRRRGRLVPAARGPRRLRPAGAVAAGWTPAESGPDGVVPSGSVPMPSAIPGAMPDGAMPDGRASADGVPHERASRPVAPKGPPPSCPAPEADRPRALVVLDDAAGWPDPRGRVEMLLTGAASLGLQVWAGADGDEALTEALGVGMAAVLTEAGTVVDLRGSAA